MTTLVRACSPPCLSACYTAHTHTPCLPLWLPLWLLLCLPCPPPPQPPAAPLTALLAALPLASLPARCLRTLCMEDLRQHLRRPCGSIGRLLPPHCGQRVGYPSSASRPLTPGCWALCSPQAPAPVGPAGPAACSGPASSRHRSCPACAPCQRVLVGRPAGRHAGVRRAMAKAKNSCYCCDIQR